MRLATHLFTPRYGQQDAGHCRPGESKSSSGGAGIAYVQTLIPHMYTRLRGAGRPSAPVSCRHGATQQARSLSRDSAHPPLSSVPCPVSGCLVCPTALTLAVAREDLYSSASGWNEIGEASRHMWSRLLHTFFEIPSGVISKKGRPRAAWFPAGQDWSIATATPTSHTNRAEYDAE